jgi:hypothetical protein
VTKIVVGVGLVELGKFATMLHEFGQFARVGLGDTDAGALVAQAIVIQFAICGFLLAFLWTRVHLGPVLLGVEQKMKDFQKHQADEDGTAWNLVESQLYADEPEGVAQQDLDNAISKASKSAKIQIFMAAAQARGGNECSTERVKRTIRVFRALVNNDPESRYHRNHAQLGYALKDQTKPQYGDALSELNTAIKMRDDLKDPSKKDAGWKVYEFNRAICRIHKECETKDIFDDLEVAVTTMDQTLLTCYENAHKEVNEEKEAAAEKAAGLLKDLIEPPATEQKNAERQGYEDRVIGLWMVWRKLTVKDKHLVEA